VSRKSLRTRAGATATEYGLIAALIAVVIIGATASAGRGTMMTIGSIAVKLMSSSGNLTDPYLAEFMDDVFDDFAGGDSQLT
jgi:Flp pilus assembly pilin Flp